MDKVHFLSTQGIIINTDKGILDNLKWLEEQCRLKAEFDMGWALLQIKQDKRKELTLLKTVLFTLGAIGLSLITLLVL